MWHFKYGGVEDCYWSPSTPPSPDLVDQVKEDEGEISGDQTQPIEILLATMTLKLTVK